MNTSDVFWWSLYVFVALVGWTLACADGSWIPAGTVALCLLARLWTDRDARRGLGEMASNFAGFLALALATWEFFSDKPDGKLLAGAHLLVYLTWIVLLQHKSDRHSWSLCALCALQIAVASVLTNEAWFGAAAIGYSVLGTWTLSVFFLSRAEREFATPASGDVSRGVSFGGARGWVNRPFVIGVAGQSVVALIVSGLFFVFTPRIWLSERMLVSDAGGGEPLAATATSGFVEQVRLGDMGTILASVAPVMRVRIGGGPDGEVSWSEFLSGLQTDDFRVRGKTLEEYSDGIWKGDPAPGNPLSNIPRLPLTYYQQTFSLESSMGNQLFSIGYPSSFSSSNAADRRYFRFYPLTQTLLWDERGRSGTARSIEYVTFTSPPFNANFWPVSAAMRDEYERTGYLSRCLVYPREQFARTTKLAERIASGVTDDNPVTRNSSVAQAIESYLRNSSEYAYTLKLDVQDATIDPIEDFLFNRKEGHCEYFAAALAIMLRSVGIPSRIVSGYRCSEDDVDGGSVLQVQDRHAHVWVEAFVTRHGRFRGQRSYWLTLDATPAARDEAVASVPNSLSWMASLRYKSTQFWQDYILGVSFGMQRESLYKPTMQLAAFLWDSAVAMVDTAKFFMAAMFASPGELFSAQGGLFLAGLLGVTAGLVFAVRWLWRWVRQVWLPSQQTRSRRRVAIAFYEQYLRLARSQGLSPGPSTTPLEFADQFVNTLRPKLTEPALQRFPGMLCDLFYSVRFGGSELSPGQISELNAGLVALRTALGPSSRR